MRDRAAEAAAKRAYREAHPRVKVERETYWTPDREAELVQALAEGKTMRQIANKWGVSKNTISGKIFRMGLDPVNARDPIIAGKLRPFTTLGITTMERLDALNAFPDRGHCCFPDGDHRQGGLTFCGEPVASEAEPYCGAHRARCGQPVLPAKAEA